MKGKRKKKKFSQRKVNRRKRISKARKGKSVFWSGKMTTFTFIIGFLLGLFSIFLFWPHLVTKPVLAFPSSDSHVVIVFSYQSIEIQSIVYKKAKHEPITSSTTNLHITIIPSRRLVVDEKNDIKEIYSNTGESNEDFKLFASYETFGNQEVNLLPKILAQYKNLEPQIDWSQRGLVYKKN